MCIKVGRLFGVLVIAASIWSPVYGDYKGIPSTVELANMDATMSACLYTGLIPEVPAQDVRHIIGLLKTTGEVDEQYFKKKYKAARESIVNITERQFKALCAATSQAVYGISHDYQEAYCSITKSDLCG